MLIAAWQKGAALLAAKRYSLESAEWKQLLLFFCVRVFLGATSFLRDKQSFSKRERTGFNYRRALHA